MDIMLTRIIELLGNEHGSIAKLAKQLGVSGKFSYELEKRNIQELSYLLGAARFPGRLFYFSRADFAVSFTASMQVHNLGALCC